MSRIAIRVTPTFGMFGPFATAVNHGKYHGHKKQRSKSGEEQTADDGAAQRSVLLAALAQADRHRNHADDHGQRGHDDRAHAHKTSFESGVVSIFAFVELLARKGHHQDAVGGGHADGHDSSGERRDVQSGVRDEQDPANAGERAGQRGDDDEGIEPRLEVDDNQKINEDDSANEADGQPGKGALHGEHLAANHDVTAPGELAFDIFDLLGNFVGDAAEVAAVDGSVDIDHGLDIVVGNLRGAGGRNSVDHVAKDLRRSARDQAAHGDILQALHTIDAVLGRLHGHVVADAVFGIEPESGSGLKTGAKGYENVLCNVAGLQADGLCARAINIHTDRGAVKGLLYVDIDGTGDVADLVGKFFREQIVSLLIGAGHLHIDGGGNAEIQNLRDDVRGLEEKLHAGELLGKFFAEILNVVKSGLPALIA